MHRLQIPTRSPRSARPKRALLAGLLALSLTSTPSAGDDSTRPDRGPHRVDPRWHALVHAQLVTAPGESLDDATIVWRDGVIVSVEAGGSAPEGARVWDASGLHVYPGFIDPHVPVATPKPAAGSSGMHWNASVLAQRSVLDGAGPQAKVREELRELGFAVAAVAPEKGIFRGRAAVLALGDGDDTTSRATASVLAEDVYQSVSFDRAPIDWGADQVNPAYPSSEMGVIALQRQTLSDADWYARAQEVYAADPGAHEPPAVNDALAALGGDLPLYFETSNELQLLRAAKVAEEFGRAWVGLGSGTEFRRLEAVAALGTPLVVPLNFPEEPKVGTLAAADRVSLRELQTWEQAPTNLRRLSAAGVTVALTSDRLKKRADFWPNLRKALEHGLTPEQALAMLTTVPAELLGQADRVGRVAPGMLANLVVASGDLFATGGDDEAEIRDVWVGGRRYEVQPAPAEDLFGDWNTTLASAQLERAFEGTLEVKKKKVVLEEGEKRIEARNVHTGGETLRFLVDGEELGGEGTWSFTGALESGALHGTFFGPGGEVAAWHATRAEAAAEEEAAEDDGSAESDADGSDAADEIPETLALPFGAYGYDGLPEQRDVLVTGATVWTSGAAGILEDGALLVRGGRIVWVGPASEAPDPGGAAVVDASGKHVTPGLIDCHSHTGSSGSVNEVGQRVTAEVRVSDVINPDAVDFYRQLAGGLTAANQLHGSANAIGGQNSVVKLRWGAAHPDDMRLEGAKPGIKFALGENPKRVAANTGVADEYPRTRMGVATLIRDRLLAGRHYRQQVDEHAALDAGGQLRMPPRRDLELEAMGEIVAGERLIHCHSYRQDEILMLCRVAQELGFEIGTFQHVLEGYKVAEAIQEVARGASTFADWWAYKFEVIDAIPFNATLMTDVGVNVSINSDSGDHARRLNTEAAKAVKYGRLDPAEALKLVTYNPAYQLDVHDRVGSLEEGKDADFVIWSHDPLSTRAVAEATWIDGREYFSLERDAELRAQANRERQRLIQKIYGTGKKDKDSKEDEADGGSVEEEPASARARRFAELAAADGREGDHRRGECGCDERSER